MILYFIIGVIIISSYKLYQLIKCPTELENIPAAPFWSFLIVSLSKDSFNTKMQKYLQPMLDEYGVIRVFDYMGWSLLVGDPKVAKEISMKSDIFYKHDMKQFILSERVRQYFGPSQILHNNGQEWKRHRKIINPIFNQSWSTELFGVCVQDLIEEWEKRDGEEVQVHDLIQRLTLDVLGKAIFDIDFKAVKKPDSHIFNLYNHITDQVVDLAYWTIPYLDYMPFFKRPNLSKELKEYDEFVETVIESKKLGLQDLNKISNNNLINALIQSNENTDEFQLSHNEIRDNIKIFILAGHDTTSNTLTSTLYYLARYPEIQNKLRNEVLEAVGNPKVVVIPTIEQLKNIPYMDMVNKESMRIMTTAGQVERVATEHHTLSNGITVPKHTQVILHLWGIHHNAQFFPNPDEFNPERFKHLSSEESRGWQPFVTGPRACIGTTFSMIEQRVTIAMLLQKYEFRIGNDNPDYHLLRLSPISIIRPSDLKINIKIRA